MNKDVIYIEPEDDITDILTDIKNSKTKIVALVPPKKANVLKSAVNFKLLARTAKESGKAVVLITTDSALLKLAAVAKIPVAKNLQSKPEIVTGDSEVEEPDAENDVIDGEEAAAIVKDDKKITPTKEAEAIESVDLESDNKDTDDEPKEKPGKQSAKKKSIIPNFEKYRKFIIAGAAALVLIVGFLIWALGFAPAAKIVVTVKTTARQFSENVSFVTDEAKEDYTAGVFLLEDHKVVKTSSVDFEATGEVDKGTKATGTLTFKRNSASSSYQNAITIAKGTKYTHDGKVYITTEAAKLDALDASNSNCSGSVGHIVCTLTKDVTATAKVEAEVAGTDYNIAAASSGWTPAGSGYTISSSAMTGGTSKIVKIVSAEDITKATANLTSTSTSEGKAELNEEFPIGLIAISSSFKAETGDPVSSPALGEEVAEGVTPKLTAKTTFSMYGVDRVRVSDYIESRVLELIAGEEDQKVYSTGVSDEASANKAFIESFKDQEGKYTAKLKSTAKIGPEVTEEMVINKTIGKKIGEVQSLLKSIKGISNVDVQTSVFWVSSIPKNINKVSVEITVE